MSEEAAETGFGGKLPSHDDFIEGGGALSARHTLMEWAGAGLVRGREGKANRFTDMFLTMPVWRFAMEPTLCTERTVVGILCPSTDRTGRAFPILIVAEIAPRDALATLVALGPWFDAMEGIALGALDGSVDASAFGASLASPPVPPGSWTGTRPFHDGIRAVKLDDAGLPAENIASAGYWVTRGGADLSPFGLSHSAAPDEDLFLALVAAEQPPERS